MLETLVKLASLGTAGVSVLAIFYIGTSILKLPNDSPEWKPLLMKKYINMCIVISIICAVSGCVNAYFNRNKIAEAKNEAIRFSTAYGDQVKKVEKFSTEYDIELKKVEEQKKEITASFDSLKTILAQKNTLTPQLSSTIKETETRIKQLQIKPKEEIIKDSVISLKNN